MAPQGQLHSRSLYYMCRACNQTWLVGASFETASEALNERGLPPPESGAYAIDYLSFAGIAIPLCAARLDRDSSKTEMANGV